MLSGETQRNELNFGHKSSQDYPFHIKLSVIGVDFKIHFSHTYVTIQFLDNVVSVIYITNLSYSYTI